MRRFRRPALLAVVAALLLTAVLAVSELATLRGAKAHDASVLLTKELGPPLDSAPLVRRPAHDLEVTIDRRGFTVDSDGHSVTVSSPEHVSGDWRRYQHGVARRTPSGTEAIAIHGLRTEQSVVVEKPQGKRTWRWALSTPLRPRLGPNGRIEFVDPTSWRISELTIAPVKIYDGRGKDVTPKGLTWALGGTKARPRLELALDDEQLPHPYVIDPIVIRSATVGVGFTSADSGGVATGSLSLTKPSGTVARDLLIAHVTVQTSGTALTIVPPNGWTSIRKTDNGTTVSIATYYHVYTGGSDAGPYVFTWENPPGTGITRRSAGGVTAYVNTETGGPIDTSFPATGASTTANVIGITTAGTNELIFYAEGNQSGRTQTTPPSILGTALTERYNQANTATAANADRVSAAKLTGVLTTGQTLSGGGSPAWAAQIVAILPDTTPPTNAISPLSVSPAGSAYYPGSGTTLWYRGTGAGCAAETQVAGRCSFKLRNAASDASSGPASSTFAALGSPGGWQFTSGTTSTPAGGPYDSNYFSWASGESASPTESVTATDNNGNTNSATTWTFTNDSTGPAVPAPTVTAGYYTLLSVPVSLGAATDTGGSGVNASSIVVQRDEIALTNGSCGSFPGSWSTVTLSGGNDTTVASGMCYRYREVAADNVGNSTNSSASNTAQVDNTNPSNSLSLTSVSPAGTAFVSGGTIYYRGAQAGGGSFKIRNAVSDPESGPASSQTASLGGTTTGWTHTASTVSSPAGGPFDSNNFTWAQDTTSSPTEVVTGRDAAGNATAAGTLNFTNDSTAPAGGGALTVNATAASAGGTSSYDTDGNFAIGTRTDYTETQSPTESGLASSTLVRTSASYTTPNACGAFGSPATIVGNPDQSSLATGCYRYTLTGTDNVGNTVSISTVVKVDTSNPGLTLTVSNGTGTAYTASGRAYFRANGAGGSFDVTGNGTDDDTDIASYAFPAASALGTNWSASGSGSSRTYSYTPTATTNGTQTVSTTNNAGRTGDATFDLVDDSAAPTAGAVSVNGVAASGGGTSSYDGDGNFSIDTRTDYSEAQSATASGLASSTLVRTSASYSSPNVCGAFGSPTTLVGTPAQSSLATGCYRYTLTGTDNVGNAVSIATVVKVDTSDPTLSLSFANLTGGTARNGTRIYFKPDAAGGGSFDVTGDGSDSDSDIASYGFPAGSALGTNWSASGSGATRTYSFSATATTNGSSTVTTTNNAGRSAGADFDLVADSAAPGGGALTVNATAASAGGTSSYDTDGTFTIGTRTDYSETQSPTESGLASSTLVRTNASYTSPNVCGAFGSPATIVGNPDQSGLATGCYRYTLTGTDNVGNTVSIQTTVKVDTSNPSAPALTFSNVTGNVSVSGTIVSFLPTGSGSFDVTADSDDDDTDIASYTFPSAASFGSGWSASGSGATRSYSFVSGAATPGTQTVTAANGAGRTASSDLSVIVSDTTAPTTTIQCNAAACQGTYYTSSPVAVTLSADDGVGGSGVQVIRYTIDGTDPTPVNGSDYVAPVDIVTTTTLKFRAYDNVGNEEAVGSKQILVDGTPPTVSLTLSENPASAAQHVSGTTVFYRPGAGGGTFRVEADAQDAQTGVTSVDFPAVSGVTGGGSQTSAPFREDYSWSSSTTDTGSHNAVATNGAGATTNASFTLTQDSAAPSGQSLTLTGAGAPYYGSASVSFSLGDGNDGAGSGLDTSTRTVTRETGDLVGDACSNFSADAGTFTSPDSAVSGGHCYRYTFTIADHVGNVSGGVSAVAKVDTANPTVSVSAPSELTGTGNQYYQSGTKTLFYRSTGSGSFRLNASAADTHTAVNAVGFPDLSALSNWTGSGGSDPASPYSSPTDYSWAAGAAEPAASTINATDKAGNTGSDTITVTDDTGAPSGQAITLTGATAPYFNTASVTFALTDGNDGTGAGIDTSSRTVTRETGDLSGGACSNFSADAGTFTSPDTAVSGAHCYRYTFTIADNVGNTSAAVSTTAKVDTNAPNVNVTAPVEVTGAGNQYYDAGSQTHFFRPGGSGSFTLGATAGDPDSGVAQVAFPDISAVGGWNGSTGGADTTSPYASPVDYSWTAGATAPGARSITATNGASIDGTGTITLAADAAAPTGQSLTLTGAGAPYYGSASVSFSLGDGNDGAGSGLDTSTRTVTRETGDLSGDACSNFSADPGTFTSPDSSVSGGHCYRYTFTIADHVGNVSSGVSATAKVDTANPTVSVSAPTELTAAGNQYYQSGTKTLFFRSTGSGSFRLNATAADTHTAVDNVGFPDLSALSNWTGNGGSDPGAPYSSSDYSWSAGAVEPAARSVVATDEAGNTGSDTITVTDDTSAPSGQAITLTGATAPYFNTASVTFTLGDGNDGTGAGIDTSSRTVTRETGDLAGDSCSNFSAGAGTFTSPDTAVSGGHCYRYTFTIADNVGNTSATVTTTAKVDTAGPSVSLTDPGTPLAGTVALSATASDAATDVQQVVFERSPEGSSTWTTIGTDTTPPYSVNWDTTSISDGMYDLRAVATDEVDNSSTDLVSSRRVDNTAPNTTIDSTPPDPSNDATPTFTFSSSEPGSSFACRVDGGGWGSCTSPETLSALGAGSHTFGVRATDPAGNTDPAPASHGWTIDLTAPNTTIDSSPPSPSGNATPTFTFSSSEPGSTFECGIDGGSWSSCTSPHTISPALTEGSHTFEVRATDQAGNSDATPASRTWTIDLGAPTVSITAPTTYVNGSDPNSYPVTASTPDTDVARVDFFECSNASAACATGSWVQFGTDNSAPYAATWSTPAFDGPKAIRALAVDLADNTGEQVRTISIDRTAPSNVTVSYPNGYVFGSFSITTGNGPDSDVDASTGVIERQTGTLASNSCSSYGGWASATSPDTIASGSCAVYRYRVADNAGNWATATSSNEAKSDTAAPTSSHDDPGANLRQTVSLTAPAGDSGGSGIASVAFQRRPSGGGSWTTIDTDTASPYSTSFDTTGVADGLYDFRSVATDVAGNVETSPVVVSSRRIDNTAPSATMLSPGNPVRATLTLTSNTSDTGSGIASVSYELAPNGGSFNSQPASWDTTLSVDGLYDLRVLATDVAGNSTTSSSVTTRVDNTPPALTFSSPASGAVVSGTVNLVGSASDASPANPPVGFAYKLHSDPPSAYTATGASWNTTALPAGDGVYDLRARVTDDAGNTTTAENTSIRVDNVPPTITITAPPSAINDSLPSPTTFSATASDTGGSGVTQVQFFECSNQSTDCATGVWSPLGTVAAPGPYGVSWTIPGADGNHALAAVATDNAGHPASAIRNVDVDRTAPNTTIVTKPADPSNDGTPTFSFSSSEAGSTFECKVDGGSFAPCASPHNVTGLSDNAHTFEVRATDPAGNTDATPDTWTWHRDTSAPSGTLNDPGANIRLNVTITSSENDPPADGYASGLASVSYEYTTDGTTWAPIGTLSSAPFDSIIWNTTAVTDGVYQLHVVVRDVAGNQTTSAAVTNVRIDNTPPTTSQNDPGQYLRATKTLSGSAADSGSGVDHVDFQRAPTGGGSWTTIGTDSTPGDGLQVTFDTTAVSDGHYDFRTVAYDVAGNQAASTAVTDRLVDNTPPNATINNPGAYLRGAVNLTSSTSDPGGANASGVVSVAYEYSTNGGGTWQSTGASFDSTAVPDGNVSLHVIATDAAGNSTTSATVTSLADNTKPATTDNAPGGWQSSAVTVTLSASDGGSGVNVTEYSVDGNPSYTVGTSVTIPAPADGSNDGAHTIAYFSADNAGNIETVKSTTVLIDATPPACPSCSAADYLRGTVTLSASPSESGSGIQSVAFEYTTAGGATWITIGSDATGPAPYTVDWDTTAVADGHYDLRILVTDNASNVTTTSLPDKVIDNTAPDVALVGAPTEGQLVTGTVAITASASDVTSPVASVQFFVGGSLLGTDTSAPFSLDWNTTTGADGAATIQVVVADMAGNTTSSPVRNVSVDNVSPTPTLADPGQFLSGTVSLSAASDPDTTQVDFERRPAGGGSWVTIASDTTLPWGMSLDTATLPDGLYDFRVVATDQTGHTGSSAIRSNVRVDNTAPAGSLTTPASGSTVGGSNVALGGFYSDAGSGVASVRYELRPTGGGSWTTIATATGAPFGATWDATTVSSGSYDLRPVITDRAGNSFTGATVTVDVDVTAPTVVLTNPGATISGTINLAATVSGSGATAVAFGVTPAGGAGWTAIGTDTTSPWSAAFDTTTLADGLYDLRAVVSDGLGNSSVDVVAGIRIDNTAPRVISSTPADGTTVTSASSISLVTSEAATPVGVTLDGNATVAPVINGANITYGTGALSSGAHTLAGELEDSSGKKAPFRIHFTVWSSSGSVAPYVEKNTSTSSSTTVESADGFAAVTMPSGAWSTSGSDWIVIRIAPMAAPSGLTNGFAPGPEALDVTAWWALAGTQIHQLSQPVGILMRSTERGLVPATFEAGSWRVLARVPVAGTLPAGWDDGFYSDATGFHLMTRHLSVFALLRDLEPPRPPQNVRGFLGPGGLTLRWLPGADNSGTYDYVTVFFGSTDIGHYGVDYTAAGIGSWSVGDPRVFRLKETDLAGNESSLTPPLRPVPPLVGLTPDQAEAALAARGFTLGTLTVDGTGRPGTVTGPVGLVLAEEGATIDLTVAPGGGGLTRFVFKVHTAPKFKPSARKTIAARVSVTRTARVNVELFSPRRVKLFTWRFSVKAGRTIVKLRIPSQVRRSGVYTLRWNARAGRDTVSRRIKIRLLGMGHGPVVKPAQPIEVVLTGPATNGVGGKLAPRKPRVVAAQGVEPTFDAAANRARDVRVIVVDADVFGVPFIRDLHTVFPSVKIIALTSSPRRMASALKAGAAIVLPRSTPPATIAKVIQRLLAKPKPKAPKHAKLVHHHSGSRARRYS